MMPQGLADSFWAGESASGLWTRMEHLPSPTPAGSPLAPGPLPAHRGGREAHIWRPGDEGALSLCAAGPDSFVP